MSDIQQMRPSRIEALTGLRFLAALMVFCFHFDISLQTKFFYGPMGGIAVSFFFVLSGFILTYVYRDRLKFGGLKRFYFTRWARIWPLHAVCLGAAICLRHYASPVDFPELRLASHWLLLQSWIPSMDYVLSYNGVAWSISTEAFFYLMFPLFLLGGLRNFWWKYIATLVLTALALFALTKISATPQWSNSVDTHSISHFNPLMRLTEFISGMATAYVFMSARLRNVRLFQISQWPVAAQTGIEVVALLLAAFSYYIFLWLGYYGWVSHGLGLGGEVSFWLAYCGGMPFHVLCIFVFAQSDGLLGRFFSNPLMIYLGEISFALYMVHRLIILMMIKNLWVGSSLPYWVIISSTLAITIGVSSLLFLMVEMPMKTALLKFYDRKFTTGVKVFLGQLFELLKRKTAYVSIALAVIPILLMNWGHRTRSPITAETILAESFAPQVNLSDQIKLMAWSFEPKRMGTEISLVWKNMDKPILLRHEYQFAGSNFTRKGKFYLKNEPYLQRIFVRNRHWDKTESIDLKVWKDDTDTFLSLNFRTPEKGEGIGPAFAYRPSIGPENDAPQILTTRRKATENETKRR